MNLKTSKAPDGTITVQIGRKRLNTGLTKAADLKKLFAAAGKLNIASFNFGPTVKVDQALAQFEEWLEATGNPRTAANQLTYVKAWIRDAGIAGKALDEVTEKHVDKWVNETESGAKASTRRIRLACLRAFYRFATIKQLTKANPAALVRVKMENLKHAQKEPRQKTIFKDSDLARLIKHVDEKITPLEERLVKIKNHSRAHYAPVVEKKIADLRFWRSAIVIARYTGLRLGDIAQLEWAAFGTPGNIIVWTDKRDRRVNLLVAPELQKAIATIEFEDASWCFPKHRDTVRDPKRRAGLSMQFDRLCKAAGLKGHTFHDWRHTYATDCKRKGIPMPHISTNLGHTDTKTTIGYIHE